jgi:hypothetical protein
VSSKLYIAVVAGDGFQRWYTRKRFAIEGQSLDGFGLWCGPGNLDIPIACEESGEAKEWEE